jgi:hypothetical protein
VDEMGSNDDWAEGSWPITRDLDLAILDHVLDSEMLQLDWRSRGMGESMGYWISGSKFICSPSEGCITRRKDCGIHLEEQMAEWCAYGRSFCILFWKAHLGVE